MTLLVDNWGLIHHKNGDVVSRICSAVSKDVEFEFRARIRYRGENWSKKEIPIQAKCKVNIEFIMSSNARAREF